jgi:hypothetical protein
LFKGDQIPGSCSVFSGFHKIPVIPTLIHLIESPGEEFLNGNDPFQFVVYIKSITSKWRCCMKKLGILFSFSLAIIFCIFFAIPSYAENVVIYGCYQKNNGQLRVVGSWNECLSSEVPISWTTQPNDVVNYLAVYVNASTGLDETGYGLSEDKPFKTIGYALSRIPFLRSNSDIRTDMFVASGTYNESIVLNQNNIRLRGSDRNNTKIYGDGKNNVIYVRGSLNSRISGFSVLNGGESSIRCESASIRIQDCEIRENKDDNNEGFAGLIATNNSYVHLENSNVLSNNSYGILVYRNSSFRAINIVVKNNILDGIQVYQASSAKIENSEFSNNGNSGILVGKSSSVTLHESKVLNNYLAGINLTENSNIALRGGNVIKGNNVSQTEWLGGLSAFHGSGFTIMSNPSRPKDQIVENNQNGITLSNNCNSLIINANISDNYGNGISVDFGCTGQFENKVDIKYNDGFGIICSDAIIRNSANVSDNISGQVYCP